MRLSNTFLSAFVVAVTLLSLGNPGSAEAGQGIGKKMAGTYLWVEDGDSQRVVTIARGGTFSSVSQAASEYGFTDGLGSAKRTGRNEITASQIDFNYDADGVPTGVTRVIFSMTFSDKEEGQFQAVAGSLLGKTYEVEDNPLDPSAEPRSTFTFSFSGRRVTPN
jgi:hypothetical protein